MDDCYFIQSITERELYEKDKRLLEYEILLKDIFRKKEHVLSEKEEKIITKLSENLANASRNFSIPPTMAYYLSLFPTLFLLSGLCHLLELDIQIVYQYIVHLSQVVDISKLEHIEHPQTATFDTRIAQCL